MPKSRRRKKKTSRSGKPKTTVSSIGRRNETEWQGVRVSIGYIEEEDLPAIAEVWLSLPDDLIVHHETHAGTPPAVSTELLAAVRQHRPGRIRVADDRWAQELSKAFPEVDVRCAPTTALNEVIRQMSAQIGGSPLPSYSMSGATADELMTFMATAAELYSREPWKVIQDWQIIGIDIPELDIIGACVSIIGNTMENKGYLYFSSIETYEAMASAYEAQTQQSQINLGDGFLSLNYEHRETLPWEFTTEFEDNDWPVASNEACPVVIHHDPDTKPSEILQSDIEVLALVSEALALFFDEHGSWFEGDMEEPVMWTTETWDERTIIVSAPPLTGINVERNDAHTYEDELRDLDLDVSISLQAHGEAHFPDQLAKAMRSTLPFAIALPILFYAEPILQDETLADHFLRHTETSPAERRWIDAQKNSYYTIWRIENITGDVLHLHDTLADQHISVSDEDLASFCEPGSYVVARIVSFEDTVVIVDDLGHHAGPIKGKQLVDRMKSYLRRKSAIPVDRLQEPNVTRYLAKLWWEFVREDFNRS